MENREGRGGNQLGNWLGFGLRGGEGERGGLAGDLRQVWY